MQHPCPTWWAEVSKFFIINEETYERTLSDDCPTNLKELYLTWEKEFDNEDF